MKLIHMIPKTIETNGEALIGTGRLRESLSENPHWLHDPENVPVYAGEIRRPKSYLGIANNWESDHTRLLTMAETKYDRYRRVPGSKRWWYKIT